MNLLFLTLMRVHSIEERGIYTDLLRKFKDMGHNVSIVTPVERRLGINTNIKEVEGVRLLQVKTLNIQKTNLVEKGMGTLAIEYQYLAAIKKYLSDSKFDLIVYSTPPITFSKVIRYIKNRDGAYSYLLLKDIFPQNAVDMGMMRKDGLLHSFFRRKEKKLYAISDTIGCMSQANREYILTHNSEIDNSKVEVNPNTIIPSSVRYTQEEKESIRLRYGLSVNQRIFVYGGNLGVPQGIDFLIEVLEHLDEPNAHILIVGNGTRYKKIQKLFDGHDPENATLIQWLPKKEYDQLLGACDVGLIFLDPRFTIPNFPSRLLSYLEMSLPVISATDKHTDLGKVIEEAGCGISVLSGDIASMLEAIHRLSTVSLSDWQKNARALLEAQFTADRSYDLIREKVKRQNDQKSI